MTVTEFIFKQDLYFKTVSFGFGLDFEIKLWDRIWI